MAKSRVFSGSYPQTSDKICPEQQQKPQDSSLLAQLQEEESNSQDVGGHCSSHHQLPYMLCILRDLLEEFETKPGTILLSAQASNFVSRTENIQSKLETQLSSQILSPTRNPAIINKKT